MLIVCQDIATESINGTPHPRVAVKQLLPTGLKKEDAQDFVKAEHEMLNLLRDFESPHLIKAISFYKTPGNTENLHYVFPWAEQGSLRKFWAEKTASIRGDNDVIWVFSQLLGLADAIQALHKENYRHGDLKPENILCFKVPGSRVEDLTSCVLVISDVGLSRIYDRLTQLRTQTKMAGGETKAYAAPETTIFPKRPTSRRYDIWSLGCLYLEFIIWVLYGFAELDRFRKDLKEFGGESGERFYTISDTKQLQVDGSTQFVAEVNQVVKAWIEHIKMDSRCAGTGAGTAFGYLIVLVEEQLLVVNANPTPILGPNKPVDGSQAIAASRKGADIIPGVIIQPASTIGFNVENPKTEISQTAKLKQSEENERATASEVYKELNMIVRKGKNGSIEWLHHGNGLDKVSCKGPESMTYLTSSLSRASLDKSDDYVSRANDNRP
jgi:serine/threonine protein kinase